MLRLCPFLFTEFMYKKLYKITKELEVYEMVYGMMEIKTGRGGEDSEFNCYCPIWT